MKWTKRAKLENELYFWKTRVIVLEDRVDALAAEIEEGAAAAEVRFQQMGTAVAKTVSTAQKASREAGKATDVVRRGVGRR